MSALPKRPIIDRRASNCWAVTGHVIGSIALRREFSFLADTGGCLDAPDAVPAGSVVKNVVVPRDRRRRVKHVIAPLITFVR